MIRFKLAVPSPALVISLVALFVALGGTGYAATQVIGGHASAAAKKKKAPSDTKTDKRLIKAMSGSLAVAFANNATNAKNATNATNATNAGHASSADTATNATNATNAGNAASLGGQPASAYLTSGSRIGTVGIAKTSSTSAGNKVTLFTVGPFTVSMTCTKSGNNVSLTLSAASSEANSILNGTVVPTAGTSQDLGGTVDVAGSANFAEKDDVNIDFEAPSGANAVLVGAEGINSLGTDCWANWVGVR
jgi:hypothetical protein